MKISVCCFFIICFYTGVAQVKTSSFLKDELLSVKDSLFQEILAYPEIYRYLLIYTQINRDKHNQPSFTNFYLRIFPKPITPNTTQGNTLAAM